MLLVALGDRCVVTSTSPPHHRAGCSIAASQIGGSHLFFTPCKSPRCSPGITLSATCKRRLAALSPWGRDPTKCPPGACCRGTLINTALGKDAGRDRAENRQGTPIEGDGDKSAHELLLLHLIRPPFPGVLHPYPLLSSPPALFSFPGAGAERCCQDHPLDTIPRTQNASLLSPGPTG